MRKKLGAIIYKATNTDVPLQSILNGIEIPKEKQFGDYSFPCFILAAVYKKPPHIIAKELAGKINHDLIHYAESAGPYVNFHLNRELVSAEFFNAKINGKGSPKTKVMTIDFSSPNIAKPFSKIGRAHV